MSPKILPGCADPLGATPNADGTNFAVSSGGDEVTLCLFDADGVETRLVMPERRRRVLAGPAAADLRWFTPSGTEMTDQNWTDPEARAVAVLIDGSSDPDVAPDGTSLVDDDFLVFVNAWWEPLTFQIPADVAALEHRVRHLRPGPHGHRSGARGRGTALDGRARLAGLTQPR